MSRYISILDSDRFGFNVAKLSEPIDEPERILTELRKISTKLIIVRVASQNIKLINELERLGFQYKDLQVTFNFNLAKELPPRSSTNEFSIVNYDPKYYQELLEITKRSFANYGHYFADNKLPREKCLDIYCDWVRRCCEDRDTADHILVAVKGEAAIGFYALKSNYSETDSHMEGVIGAVDVVYRKLGVFQELNLESLRLAKYLQFSRLENNVLITNFPVVRTYTSLHFNIIRSDMTLHYWYD